jgi:pimeloyl-ACP methyl ester carboxylesterase
MPPRRWLGTSVELPLLHVGNPIGTLFSGFGAPLEFDREARRQAAPSLFSVEASHRRIVARELDAGGLYFPTFGHHEWQPVVLLHGLGDDGSVFDSLATTLAAASYFVIVPDLPGHGMSSRVLDSVFSLGTCAEILEALLVKLGAMFCDVVGHSLGADLAVSWASSSQRIRRLILISPHLDGCGIALPLAVKARQERLRDNSSALRDLVSRATNLCGEKGSSVRNRHLSALEKCNPSVFIDLALNLCDLCSTTISPELEPSLLSLASGLTILGFVIVGSEDERLSLRVVSTRCGFMYHVIPECGHWPMLDQPALLGQAVLACRAAL